MSRREECLNSKLIRAVEAGDYRGVIELLERGADVHTRNEYCICSAVSNGYSKTVKLLINAGADVTVHENYIIRDAIIKEHDGSLGEILKTAVIDDVTLKDALNISVCFNKVRSLKVILQYCELSEEMAKEYLEKSIRLRSKEVMLALIKSEKGKAKSRANFAINTGKKYGCTMAFMEPLYEI